MVIIEKPNINFLKRARRWVSAALVLATGFAPAISNHGLPQSPQPAPPATVLFRNVRIFDGKVGTLSVSSNLLVRGNKIERVSTSPITVDSSATIIDGGGRTLMPG